MIVKYLNEIIYTPEENISYEEVEPIKMFQNKEVVSELIQAKLKEEQKMKKMQSVVAALNLLGSIRYVTTEIQDSFDYNYKQQVTRLLDFHKNNSRSSVTKKRDIDPTSEPLIGEQTNLLSRFFCHLFNHSQNILRNHLQISRMTEESLKNSEKETSIGMENFSIQFFWRSLESEIERLITSHLIDEKSTNSLSEVSKVNRPLFKFSNSSAAFNPLTSESSFNKDLIVPPNPFHVVKLYPIVSSFSNNVTKLFEKSLTIMLKENLDSFIVNKFFFNLENHYLNKLNLITNMPNAFKLNDRVYSTYHFDELYRPLLPTAIKVYDYICEIIESFKNFKSYVDQFSKILLKLLNTFYDRCLKEYNGIVQGTETFSRLKSTNLLNHLSNDPLWVQVLLSKTQRSSTWKPVSEEISEKNSQNSGFISQEEESYFFDKQKKIYNKECETFETKYCTDPLPKSRIITEHSNLVVLATLCDSLEWFSSKLLEIFKTKNKKVVDNMELLLESFSTYGLRFEELSDSCLISLRVEMRHHCFSFLAPLQNAIYHSTSSVEGDFFIEQLCEDIKLVSEYISKSLPTEKIHFIFSSLSFVICWILVKSLNQIKKIDAQGVKRMTTNIFDLQHYLSGVISYQEESFNNVRSYYACLNVSDPNQFLEMVKDTKNTKLFSLPEYTSLIKHLKDINNNETDPKKWDFVLEEIKQLLNL